MHNEDKTKYEKELSLLLFLSIFMFIYCVCAHMSLYTCESEDNVQELVLSTMKVEFVRIKFRSSGLAESTFTC